MQSYPLKLTAAAASRLFNTAANLFVYESAAAKTRTNFLLRTEEFDNSAWTKVRATVVQAPAVVSPFFTDGVDKIVEDATPALSHAVTQKSPVLLPGKYTLSVFVKAAERTAFSLNASDGSTGRSAGFNLATGVVSYQTNGVARMSDEGGGWYRCSITADFAAGWIEAQLYLNAPGTNYNGDGVSGAYIFGAMIEAGEAPGPYIRSASGYGTSDEYESRIIVKPDTGNEIVLRPGQRFRLPPGERANQWQVRSYDGMADISGVVIIGSGEFEDSNTLNKFKLDATFSNTVQVSNTPAQRVPVTLDTTQTLPVSMQSIQINNTPAQRIPVSIDAGQVFTTSDGTVAYTKAWASNTPLAANTPVQVLSPAENVNGVILNIFGAQCTTGAGGATVVNLLAKASAPANIIDGDVVFMQPIIGNQTSNASLQKQIVIPPGKGLYLFAGMAETVGFRQALMTVL